jgi:chemotaxis protein MotB
MITYADLMALLFALFVLLLSFSEIDSDSFRRNAGPISEAFNAVPSSLPASLISTPIVTLIPLDESTPETPRRRITDRLEDALASEIESSIVEVLEEPDAVIIRFPGRAAFPSGNAELTHLFLPVLDKIGEILSVTKGQVIVAGHTDNTPISTQTFRSNWDLSAARAVSVVHRLLAQGDITPDRISVQGFADSRPLVANDTHENQSTNRRVEITVQMDDDEDVD